MLLVMRNLPSDIKYGDIKSLIQNKCFISEIILDQLVKDGATSKKVTIGVAKEEDATRILHRLNGTYVGGHQVFIEDIKSSRAGNNSNMSIDSNYRGQDKNLSQMSGYQQSNTWNAQQMGMNQYGYGLPADQMGYQSQQGNQPGASQQAVGYGAWMTSNTGIAPLMQNNLMGYGNQQGQQGQQYTTSQGAFGGSGLSSQMGARKELGFGNISSQNYRERGPSNERDFGAQASYSGFQKDKGSQGNWRDSQKERGRGSQGTFGSSDYRGHGSQQPPRERDTRGYGSGSFDKDVRFGSGNAQNDSRGYGSQQSFNQRDRGSNSQDTRGNSHRGSGGFDRSREGDDRKRRYSPEREGRYRGSSRDRFQRESFKFEGNQGRGFDSNRDSRDSYNRVAPPQSNYSANLPSLLEKPNAPYSWSNANTPRTNDKPKPFGGDSRSFGGDRSRSIGDIPKPFGGERSRTFDEKPKPFGGDQFRSFGDKPRTAGPNYNKDQYDDTKSKIVWNSKYQPPRPQNPPRGPPPEKRPKIEKKPAVVVVKDNKLDQKTVNRAISWRGEGVSSLAKEIMNNQGKNNPLKLKKGSQTGWKLLKKTLSGRVEQIIKQKFPNNPYPPLPAPEIVKLYREKYPVTTDGNLCISCSEDPSVPNLVPKPDAAPPPIVKTSPPSVNTGPQVPRPIPEVKPFIKPRLSGPKVPRPMPEVKPSAKPTLSDLLPPQLVHKRTRSKLMLGPNALKKKPKPYNVEKRARAEQKQRMKREFLEEDFYKCQTPAMEKALNTVLDEITDVFNSAVDEFPTKTKEVKLIGETIKLKAAPELRAMVRLHTIKRLLNVTNTLMLRIFVSPGKATKENVEQALKPYGLVNLKSSTQSKTPMFTAGVKSYYNYDRLCTTAGIPVQGKTGPAMIAAKPLHLTMPFKFRRLLRQKRYVELTGDHDEQDDIGGLAKDDDDDDNDDDGDDNDDDGDDNDDDVDDNDSDDVVVQESQENVVIELSGDEIKDEKPDGKTEGIDDTSGGDGDKSVCKESTVDLTMDEDVNLTMDEKMSAAIEEEMGDSFVEIDEDEIKEDDLEDY